MKLKSLWGLNMSDYLSFLEKKKSLDIDTGFEVRLEKLNRNLFDWQRVLVRWSLRRGRAALFEDCGLGKTIQQLVWSDEVARGEKGPVLILAPLAVAEQTKREGEKFGVRVNICQSGSDVKSGVNISNYEKLHKFDPTVFCGIVLDESSILKSFSGHYRNEIISSFKRTPYRLACTATPAPNDYMELGNHAEFLGVMSRMEMLSMFFINDSGDTGKWRLKGHVEKNAFWEWLSSWAIMLSKPSDLGFDDDGFILPKISYHEHFVKYEGKPSRGFGLIKQRVGGLNERRKVRKESTDSRCALAIEWINRSDDQWVIWCGLNLEGEVLEEGIKNSVQVAGKHTEAVKTDRMLGFSDGRFSRIITKPKIAGHGMNWQNCNYVAFVGLSDSWEDFYQATRRVWRFGQKKSVEVHIFLEEREGEVLDNIRRKDDRAKSMLQNMVWHMGDLMKRNVKGMERSFVGYNPSLEMEVPKWIS